MTGRENLKAGEWKAILKDVPDYYDIRMAIRGISCDAGAFAKEVEIDSDKSILGPNVEHGIVRLMGNDIF